MQIRQIADRLWGGLGHRKTALLVLIALSLIQITTLLLPQIPVSTAQSVAYSRWLAELRPRLGEKTRVLAALGLLTLRSSTWMRLTLGMVGLLSVVNLEALRRDHSMHTPKAARIEQLLLGVGGLMIIGGWAGQMLWGWQEPDVTAWPTTEIVVPQRALTIPQPRGPIGLWQSKVGLYVIPRGQRMGLEVYADQEGRSLPLLPSVDDEPQETLHVSFSAQKPEAFFAIQDANLIFRLVQLGDIVQAQAYRSPSGALVAEAELGKTTDSEVLQLNGATVTLTPVLLPRYAVTYNPGALFEGVGIALFAAGVVIAMTVPIAEDDQQSPDLSGSSQATPVDDDGSPSTIVVSEG